MKLPKINRIIIENFSLYKLQRRIEIEIPNGVMCLAGANGLGKSTFISIVSYAMSGVVVQPDIIFKSLNSIPAFAQKTVGFASRYFDGRVEQRDRDQSKVTVEFRLGDYIYHLTRNFFDSSELMEFSRVGLNQQETVNMDKSLLSQYHEFFIQDAELNSFDQYLFLQTYVMTFDESKKLLFWDEDVMNRVMYLFFSINPEDAEKADRLRKDINRYGSNVRNIQWDISQMEKRLSKLRNNGTITEEEKNEIEQACNKEEQINQSIEEEKKREQDLNAELKQVKLLYDENVVALNALKEQFDTAFGLHYSSSVRVESDRRIQDSLKKIIVALSNDENADISDLMTEMRSEIVKAIKRTKALNEKANIDQLKSLDQQMMDLKSKGKETKEKYERLSKEIIACQSKIVELANDLAQYRKQYEVLLNKRDSIKQSEQALSEIKALELNIAHRKKEKNEAETKRNACQEELRPLEDSVKQTFTTVAEVFIPTFRDYAKSFIGLDIDIELKDVNNMANLVINVNGSDRRSRFQLSESQQYFLDIALRFSLIEYTKSENAFMLIDTPEGSLDIAYESRAGKMFADFVAKGYSVIMTANINTSQLLLKLAEMCGKNRMRVERMTDWTILTQVQQEEEDVIEEAYCQIENKLLNRHG